MRVHYKGSSTFCCNSDAPCAEHAEKYPPAQSDAPSAETEMNLASKFLKENFIGGQVSFVGCAGLLVNYAALHTARWENLAKDLGWAADPEFFRTNIAAFRGQIAAYMELYTKVAPLERERDSWRRTSEKLETEKVAAKSALSEARERAQKALSDIQDIRLTTAGMERPIRLGEKYGVAHGIAVAIIDAETILQRALLAGASGAAGKGGADAGIQGNR